MPGFAVARDARGYFGSLTGGLLVAIRKNALEGGLEKIRLTLGQRPVYLNYKRSVPKDVRKHCRALVTQILIESLRSVSDLGFVIPHDSTAGIAAETRKKKPKTLVCHRREPVVLDGHGTDVAHFDP